MDKLDEKSSTQRWKKSLCDTLFVRYEHSPFGSPRLDTVVQNLKSGREKNRRGKRLWNLLEFLYLFPYTFFDVLFKRGFPGLLLVFRTRVRNGARVWIHTSEHVTVAVILTGSKGNWNAKPLEEIERVFPSGTTRFLSKSDSSLPLTR